MEHFLATGTLLGLSAGFAPGPLLALVISETLRYNVKEGMKVALAPLLTDVPIVAVTLLVVVNLAAFQKVLGLISLLGGLFVCSLGLGALRTKGMEIGDVSPAPQSLKKGVLINALSPHPYLFWLTVGGPLLVRARGESLPAAVAFVASFYVLLVGSKMFLALAVGRSRTFLTGRGYLAAMRVLGVLLCAFALLLLRDGLRMLGLLPGG